MMSSQETPSRAKKVIRRNFTIIDVIGYGNFSKLYKVHDKNENVDKISCIKVVTKNQETKEMIAIEKKILERIEHPFVVKLFSTFECKRNSYFVLEYLAGGDLQKIISMGAMPEYVATFYIKEVILALEYLHNRGIIHHDVKPKNVLLDGDGHIKLADFGLSEENMFNGTLSYTCNGTHAFMAPEILIGKGHGVAVDCWSLGVMFYFMLMGSVPFQDEESIVKGKYYLPMTLSFYARSLITKLLKVDESQRLGSTGAGEIKSHSYFKNTDWDKVLCRSETPPDLSYYDYSE